ncbi:PrsW family intramembrane metalloprotease [Stackebrandtia soli]|uniref:PrsW family intramembrane metalloprotease n=1 Tax=Stackebrandtia soli TaxID=1892856 RepID=UPI0039EC911B
MTAFAEPQPMPVPGPMPGRVDPRSPGLWVLLVGIAFGAWQIVPPLITSARGFGEIVVPNLLVTLVASLIGLTLIRRLLRPVEAPPWSGTWLMLLWGGFGATGVAILANDALQAVWAKGIGISFGTRWGAASTAPLNEEAAKAAGVLLLAAVSTRLVRSAADGVVFGALSGLGFEVVENLLYGFRSVAQAGGVDPVGASAVTIGIRVVLTGLGSHWAMSVVACAGVGYLVAANGRPLALRLAVAFGCFLWAVGMHWLFDSPLLAGTIGVGLKVLVNFVSALVVILVVRALFRRRVRQVAAEETDLGVLWPGETATLLGRHARRKARRRFHRGPKREAQASLQRAQLDLLEERVPVETPVEAADPWRAEVRRRRERLDLTVTDESLRTNRAVMLPYRRRVRLVVRGERARWPIGDDGANTAASTVRVAEELGPLGGRRRDRGVEPSRRGTGAAWRRRRREGQRLHPSTARR